MKKPGDIVMRSGSTIHFVSTESNLKGKAKILWENIVKKKYIAVDEENHWLTCGDFDSPEAALADAKKAEDYDPEVGVFIYEVVAGWEVPVGESKLMSMWNRGKKKA